MLRDARTQALVALVAWTLALALTRTPRRADPKHMSQPSRHHGPRMTEMLTRAAEELRPGALVAMNALPASCRLIQVLEFNPDKGTAALTALDLAHDDMEIVLTLGQVLRSWTVVQHAPHVPNVLSDADMDLLRTRVDQRG